MFRRLTRLIAFGALAAGAAVSTAAADPWYGCGPCDQFYLVNHGPVFTGPGIVVSPHYFDFNFDAPPAIYPYVGPTYWYRPYDGGPYADPIRHRVYHRYQVGPSYSPVEVYEPAYRSMGPQIIRVSGRYRHPHYLRTPRRMVMPPLDPRNK